MLGAVWSPSFAAQAAWSDRLDIGVTFYRHTIENAIQAPDAQAILERCVFQADPVACAAYDRSDRGQIVRFDDILDNLGTIKTDGWDVNVGWTLPEGDWGRLRFDWKNTFVGRYRSEEHTSELQSLMRISYAVFCLKKTKQTTNNIQH